MSSWGNERWEPLKGMALLSIQAVASAGMGGGSGSGGSTVGSVVSPPQAVQAMRTAASQRTGPERAVVLPPAHVVTCRRRPR